MSEETRQSCRVPHLGRREQELLLACARLDAVGHSGQIASFADADMDWDAVTWHARLHSVAPLLHRHLGASPDYALVPKKARTRLLELFHRTGYQNLHFAAEHRRLVRAFEDERIELVVPKGLPIAEQVYGSLGLRPLIDLLFLVRPGRLGDAARVLRNQGFTQRSPKPLEQTYRWPCPQLWFSSQRQVRIPVALFSVPSSWPRFGAAGADGMWSRARPGEIAGAPGLLLSPADQVIYLCMQADNTGYFNRVALDAMPAPDLLFARWSNNRLIRFVDVHECVRRLGAGLDWDEVLRISREEGLEEPVHVSLTMTARLLGPVAGEEVLGQLRPGPPRKLRAAIFKEVAGTQTGSGQSSPKALFARAWSGSAPRRQLVLARVLSFLEFAFPGREAYLHQSGPTPGSSGIAYLQRSASVLGRSASIFIRESLNKSSPAAWAAPAGKDKARA